MKKELENLKKHFLKNGKVVFYGPPGSMAGIRKFERDAKVTMPEEIRKFYLYANGLEIVYPSLKMFSLEKIESEKDILVFGEFDHQHRVGFDTSDSNVDGQWRIVNCNSGYLITHTMKSFILNKVVAWVDRGREVWRKEISS